MYIRRTQTRSNATGEAYFTYRLVRSERIAGKVKQVTVLNLGRHFAVEQALWPALCVRIEELRSGQARLIDEDLPPAAALAAERIAAQLQLHQASARLPRRRRLNLSRPQHPMFRPSMSTRWSWCARARWAWKRWRCGPCGRSALSSY